MQLNNNPYLCFVLFFFLKGIKPTATDPKQTAPTFVISPQSAKQYSNIRVRAFLKYITKINEIHI